MNTLLARALILTSAVIATSIGANADPVQVGLAPAPSGVSPIRVNSMTLTGTKLNENNMLPQHLAISFTNESSTAATDVVFGLVDSQHRTIHQYEESGTFAPGTEIVKQIPYDRTLDGQIVSAEVVEATFADGSVWDQPAPVAPTSRRQATY